mgnify:CR=1 FL=1
MRQLELSRCAQVPAAELAALLAALPGPGGSGCRRYVFDGDMVGGGGGGGRREGWVGRDRGSELGVSGATWILGPRVA